MRSSRCVAFLALVLVLPLTRGFASGIEEGIRLDGPESPPLGVLTPVSVTVEVTVPRGGLWQPPQGAFLCLDSVCVRDEQGKRLEAVSGEPKKGQYRVRLDGCVRFPNEDANRHVKVSYDYRPRRVAVLPAQAGSDYTDTVPTLLETLTQQLQSRGFVLASSDNLADALVQAGGKGIGGDADSVSGIVLKLARQVDAAFVVLPGVGATESEVLAGFQSHAWVTGSGRSAYATATPVRAKYMDAVVGITVFNATDGGTVFEKTAAAMRRVRFRQFGPVRRDMIRDLTERLVREWRDAGPS